MDDEKISYFCPVCKSDKHTTLSFVAGMLSTGGFIQTVIHCEKCGRERRSDSIATDLLNMSVYAECDLLERSIKETVSRWEE